MFLAERLAVSALVLSGCLAKPNPLHGLESGAESGSTGASTTTTASSVSSADSSTIGTATTAGGASTTTGNDSASGSSGGYSGQWDVIASIAACTHDTLFDPADCLEQTSDDLCVDLEDEVGEADLECRAHLRFDLAAAPADSAVTAAELHITVTSVMSDQTGSLWLADCFAETDLEMGWPMLLGAAGPDQGMTVQDQVVVWSLDPMLFSPLPDAVCFQILPTTADGVDYGGLDAEQGDRPLLRLFYAG